MHTVSYLRALLFALILAAAGLADANDDDGPLVMSAPIVNINTADAGQLADVLVGVGMSRAQAIVAYREANGPFVDVADLSRVKGIGMHTVARNADRIVLND